MDELASHALRRPGPIPSSTLTAVAMGCCAAAINWQYVVVGVAVGVAAAVFLIVLAVLGQILC